jgi:hypothetical protein
LAKGREARQSAGPHATRFERGASPRRAGS